MITEGFDEQSVTKQGFGINEGLRYYDSCDFFRETKSGEITGHYHVKSEPKYTLVLFFKPDGQPQNAKGLLAKVNEALESILEQGDTINETIQREAGIPEGVDVVFTSLNTHTDSIFAQGDDFNDLYKRFQKAAEVLGMDLSLIE